jgi:hypothetical protein
MPTMISTLPSMINTRPFPEPVTAVATGTLVVDVEVVVVAGGAVVVVVDVVVVVVVVDVLLVDVVVVVDGAMVVVVVVGGGGGPPESAIVVVVVDGATVVVGGGGGPAIVVVVVLVVELVDVVVEVVVDEVVAPGNVVVVLVVGTVVGDVVVVPGVVVVGAVVVVPPVQTLESTNLTLPSVGGGGVICAKEPAATRSDAVKASGISTKTLSRWSPLPMMSPAENVCSEPAIISEIDSNAYSSSLGAMTKCQLGPASMSHLPDSALSLCRSSTPTGSSPASDR